MEAEVDTVIIPLRPLHEQVMEGFRIALRLAFQSGQPTRYQSDLDNALAPLDDAEKLRRLTALQAEIAAVIQRQTQDPQVTQ